MDREFLQIEQQLKSAMTLLQELKKKEEVVGVTEEANLSKDLESHKAEFCKKFQKQIISSKNAMIGELMEAIEYFDKEYTLAANQILDTVQVDSSSKVIETRSKIFCQKVHKTRGSLLSKMYENQDVRTVYHIFIAIMLVMCLGEMINTYTNKGVIIDLAMFFIVFGDIRAVIVFWFLMASWSFLIVPLVQFIHKNQLNCAIWIPIYSFIQFVSYVVPCWFCLYRELPIASGFIVTCEMVRMSLKIHSYLREKLLFGNGENEYATFIPESLVKKGVTIDYLNIPKIEIKDLKSELKLFSYFFFAPTLIYRDSYPRTQSLKRSSTIIAYLLNVVGTIFYTFIIFEGSCVPYFQESWKEQYNFKFILMSWFKAMIPGTMLLILMFFGMLHSWFNMWAEILRFGDREFYTDWWNVTNFADYYRKWNIVVHDWLFAYVYQDILRFTKGKSSKLFCFFAVFMISALVHELVLAISMRFFYPILLIMFGGPGVVYTFFSRKEVRALNVFVWSMFFVGNGLLVVFYSWEHFARKSMDLSSRYGWKSFFIPHSWGLVE
jgi:sterol O-acyltransferase